MRKVMKSFFVAACIAGSVQLFVIGVLAPRLPPILGRPVAQEERNLTVPALPELQLENRDGSVQVRAHDRAEVSVYADIRVYAWKSGVESIAREYMESLIEVTTAGDTLVVLTEPGARPDQVDIQVDYTIQVPEGADISVDNSNGNVWISRGCGSITVQGRNTDIEVVEPGGEVAAASTNGRIRVLDAVAATDLETVNGNIYAHMKSGALRAVTTNGAIVAHMLTKRAGDFDLRSQNGGITLVMTDDCGARIDAVTGRGKVKTDFAVDSGSGVRKRRRLQGVIGSGHTKLIMNTLNGNIWIARSRT